MQTQQNQMASELEGLVLTLPVRVTGLPLSVSNDDNLDVVRFEGKVVCDSEFQDIHVVDCEKYSHQLPSRVRLIWHSKIDRSVSIAPISHSLKPDQTWILVVKLKRPFGFANPAGFDYEKWLFQRQIGATGIVQGSAENGLLDQPAVSVDQWRQDIIGRLKNDFSQSKTVGLLIALVLGDRSMVTDAQWTMLKSTGTSHLFAISGLHVGLFAGGFYFFIDWLWRLLSALPMTGRWAQRLLPYQLASIAAVLAALGYAVIAGLALPTQRAVLMVTVISLFKLFKRQNYWGDGLLWSPFLIVLFYPLSPLDNAFWLSFGAVFLLGLTLSGVIKVPLSRRHKIIRFFILPQWVVFVGLFPVLIALFGEVSLLAPIYNVLLVPIVGLFLVPSALVAVAIYSLWPMLGEQMLRALLSIFDSGWNGLQTLTDLAVLNLSVATPSSLQWLLLMLASLLWLAPKATPHKWIGILAIMPLLFPPSTHVEAGQLRLTVLDVGHGLSVVAQTKSHLLLFDTGNAFSRTDAGEAVVNPFLKARRLSHIDMLVLSHQDADHIGGAASVISARLPTQIMQSAFDASGIAVGNSGGKGALNRGAIDEHAFHLCYQGLRWEWDGVEFEFLYPNLSSQELLSTPLLTRNNQSCVLKIVGEHFSVLIPADIELEAEEQLLKTQRDALDADILIAPHHGSRSSSSTGFIDAVSPQQVIYTAGYRDRFGHPHGEVIRRYRRRGVEYFNTADTGAIEYLLGSQESNNLEPILYRQSALAFWRRRFIPDLAEES